MNALILMGVYVICFAIFEATAIGFGFVTDAMLPAWSMIIFLGTTAAAFWGGLAPRALAHAKRSGLKPS